MLPGQPIPTPVISAFEMPETWPQYQTVNAAKQKFATESSDNVYIDTISAGLTKDTLQSDNAHYKGASMIKLGKLFATAVEPFLTSLKS